MSKERILVDNAIELYDRIKITGDSASKLRDFLNSEDFVNDVEDIPSDIIDASLKLIITAGCKFDIPDLDADDMKYIKRQIRGMQTRKYAIAKVQKNLDSFNLALTLFNEEAIEKARISKNPVQTGKRELIYDVFQMYDEIVEMRKLTIEFYNSFKDDRLLTKESARNINETFINFIIPEFRFIPDTKDSSYEKRYIDAMTADPKNPHVLKETFQVFIEEFDEALTLFNPEQIEKLRYELT